MSGSSWQDPAVKGNPYAAGFISATDEADNYRVRSAKTRLPKRFYRVSLHRDGTEFDTCNCDAPVRCWHIDAARLRQMIDSQVASAEFLYRDASLAELQAEDARLRAELAEADNWLVRSQLGVVGDQVLDRLIGAEVAA